MRTAFETRHLARSAICRAHRDDRGAAIPEFAIAILPILITFFGMFQWGMVAYVHLVLKHAAFVAARAEAVIHPHMPDAGSEDDVKAGVLLLFKHIPGIDPSEVQVFTSGARPMDQTLDTVKVKVIYHCGVPLGNRIACGRQKEMHMMEEASFPNQGSYYQRIWHL